MQVSLKDRDEHLFGGRRGGGKKTSHTWTPKTSTSTPSYTATAFLTDIVHGRNLDTLFLAIVISIILSLFKWEKYSFHILYHIIIFLTLHPFLFERPRRKGGRRESRTGTPTRADSVAPRCPDATTELLSVGAYGGENLWLISQSCYFYFDLLFFLWVEVLYDLWYLSHLG